MNVIKSCLSLVIFAILMGCGLKVGGPANPEERGRIFLTENDYSPETIRSVVEGGPLSHNIVVELSKTQSADVRFLVARNPHLTTEEVDLYIKDKDEFARSGAAWNPNLSRAQILLLMADKSHTVYCKLAQNPSIPQDLLLKLHAERNLDAAWFAYNPKCPDEIKEEIFESKDQGSKDILKAVEERLKREQAAAPYDAPRRVAGDP